MRKVSREELKECLANQMKYEEGDGRTAGACERCGCCDSDDR